MSSCAAVPHQPRQRSAGLQPHLQSTLKPQQAIGTEASSPGSLSLAHTVHSRAYKIYYQNKNSTFLYD